MNLKNTTGDVLFLKGIPNHILKKDSLGDWDSVYCYRDSVFNSADIGKYFVLFKDNKIIEIFYTWEGAPFSNSIQGIGRDSDMQAIEKKFGKPDNTWSSDDGLTRFWEYYKYHVKFSFKRGRVTSYGIYNPGSYKRN